ncbi:MAG: hypothetical protein IRZ16_01205 [Myxococcaceae bacterium]|nr:hypothetical protein [Myxococcaceae bacterium]
MARRGRLPFGVGCIQAQRCHTGRCPTGVATQSRWLMRGLDPALKSTRLANDVITLPKELMDLAHRCGKVHPAQVTLDHLEIIDDRFRGRPAALLFGYEPGWELPSEVDRAEIVRLMSGGADRPMAPDTVPAVA